MSWVKTLELENLLKNYPHRTEEEILDLIKVSIRYSLPKRIFNILLLEPQAVERFCMSLSDEYQTAERNRIEAEAEKRWRVHQLESADKKNKTLSLRRLDDYTFAAYEVQGGKEREIARDSFPLTLGSCERWLRQQVGVEL